MNQPTAHATKRPPRRKIPITVLTGFLGAGKTTLLNYILTHNDGLKIGVVVNDFGSINIDSKLVSDRTDTKLELSNGCICCSLGSLDLQAAIAQFVYPGSPIDYIIIEASGLAEPRDLLLNLRDAVGFSVRLDSIVGLLDAENIERNAREHPTALDQIQYADFVVINKIDLVSQQQMQDVRRLVRAVNPRARVFETARGQLDVHLILDADVWQERELGDAVEAGTAAGTDHAEHAHTQFQHFSFETDQPLEPMRFQQYVNGQLPTAIYRAKGFVNFGRKGGGRKYIFQLVGSRAQLEWDHWSGETPRTELVFIGRDADEQAVLAALEACIDPEPNEAAPAGYEIRLPKKAA